VLGKGQRAWTDGGSFIAETGFRCRHVGRFLGVPPTGTLFKLSFVVVVAFREGLMMGERFYYSLDQLLTRLGVPARAPYAGETANY
jgi:predicted ester cyclase